MYIPLFILLLAIAITIFEGSVNLILACSHKGFLPKFVKRLKDMNFLREDLVFSTHSEEVILSSSYCLVFFLFRRLRAYSVLLPENLPWVPYCLTNDCAYVCEVTGVSCPLCKTEEGAQFLHIAKTLVMQFIAWSFVLDYLQD